MRAELIPAPIPEPAPIVEDSVVLTLTASEARVLRDELYSFSTKHRDNQHTINLTYRALAKELGRTF